MCFKTRVKNGTPNSHTKRKRRRGRVGRKERKESGGRSPMHEDVEKTVESQTVFLKMLDHMI